MRKLKPFTVYLSDAERGQLNVLAEEQDHYPSRIAARLIRSGLQRHERRRQERCRQGNVDKTFRR